MTAPNFQPALDAVRALLTARNPSELVRLDAEGVNDCLVAFGDALPDEAVGLLAEVTDDHRASGRYDGITCEHEGYRATLILIGTKGTGCFIRAEMLVDAVEA